LDTCLECGMSTNGRMVSPEAELHCSKRNQTLTRWSRRSLRTISMRQTRRIRESSRRCEEQRQARHTYGLFQCHYWRRIRLPSSNSIQLGKNTGLSWLALCNQGRDL
jgi:hypothetical protein